MFTVFAITHIVNGCHSESDSRIVLAHNYLFDYVPYE